MQRIASIFTAVALLAGLAAIQLTSIPAGAQTVQETFELEGNPQDTAGATSPSKPEDWSSLLSTTPKNDLIDLGDGVTRIAQTKVPIPDPEISDTSYYKGGGSKDERDISGSGQTWQHSANDVAPDKNSILNAAAVAYKVPDGPDGTADAPETNPDLVIDFTLDRLANDGDAVVGFWFFKNRVGYSTTDAQAFTGVHAVGDILVVSDFSGGGDVSTIRVYKWVGGSQKIVLLGGTDTATALLGGSQVDCGKANPNPYVCGTANRGANTGVDAVWPYTPKSGADGKYPVASFYEGGINVSAIVPDSDECFASFLAMTRSSTSTTAQLKDFVLGEFPICAPKTTMGASPAADSPEVAVVGDNVTFNFTENNNGNVPLTGVKVTSTNTDCATGTGSTIPPKLVTGTTRNVGDSTSTGTVGTLDPGETWQFSCTFSKSSNTVSTIDAIGHGTDPANRDTTFCTTSDSTHVCMDSEKATAKAVWITPSTLATIGVDKSTVHNGDPVVVTVTEKNDGTAPTGYESALDLTNVGMSLSPACSSGSLASHTGDTGTAGVLSQNEIWTFSCTVNAPATGTSFSLTTIGTGKVLTGTTHERIVSTTDPTSDCATAHSTWRCDADELATTTVTVISPSTELTITASAKVTYTFSERNDSSDAPLSIPGAVGTTDRTKVITTGSDSTQVCGTGADALTYVSGDSASTGTLYKLDPGETWVFTCVGTLAGPTPDNNGSGSSTSTMVGVGNGVDVTGDDITLCSVDNGGVCDNAERDRVKVTIDYFPRGLN